MPYEKWNIQLAVKLDEQNKLPEVFYKKLNEIYTPQQLQVIADMTLIEIIKAMIRRFKEYSENVNSGMDNEEMTAFARRHICDHDVNPATPCVEEDI